MTSRREIHTKYDGFCLPPECDTKRKNTCKHPKRHKQPCYCAQLDSKTSKYNRSPSPTPCPKSIPCQSVPPPYPFPSPAPHSSCHEDRIVEASNPKLYINNGISWVVTDVINVMSDPPCEGGTVLGQSIFSTSNSTLYIWNGSSWIPIGAKGVKGDIGPRGPQGISGINGVISGDGPPVVDGSFIGQLYYNTTNSFVYLWSGSIWEIFMKGLQHTDSNGNLILGIDKTVDGSNNTFIGGDITPPVQGGDNNIGLGYGSRYSPVGGNVNNAINIGGGDLRCPSNVTLLGSIQTETHVAGLLSDRRNIYDANGSIPAAQIKGGIFNMLGDCTLPTGIDLAAQFPALTVGSTIRIYFKNGTGISHTITPGPSGMTVLGGGLVTVSIGQTREILLVYTGNMPINFMVV